MYTHIMHRYCNIKFNYSFPLFKLLNYVIDTQGTILRIRIILLCRSGIKAKIAIINERGA